MKQLAIYFIPSDTDFYKKGSEIIGYDILGKKKIGTPNNKLIALIQGHNSQSSQYGFHLTLTDAVKIDEDKIFQMKKRCKLIFAIPIFKNIKLEKEKVDLMPNANVVAIQYKNNLKLLLLHILLVFFVQTLGKESNYSKNHSHLNFWRRVKTQIFLSPYILDDFVPHMTVLGNSIDGVTGLRENVSKMFAKHQFVSIDKLAVVIKGSADSHFAVKEFID